MKNTFRILGTAAFTLITLTASAYSAEDATRVGAQQLPTGHYQIPLQVTQDLKVVYQVSDDKLKGATNRGLTYVKKLLDTYNAQGVEDAAIDLHMVFHGSSITALVNTATRERLKAQGGAVNPNIALIKELAKRGVSIELCESTMQQKEVSHKDLISTDIATVVGAFPRIINLQHLGYAYIKFE